LMPDEQVYHAWARSLALGEAGPGFISDFAALPAHVYAAVYRVLGPSTDHARWFNLLLGTATCGFIYVLGRRLGGAHVGLLAGLFAALCKPLVFFSITLHGVALAVFLFAAALCVWPVGPARPVRPVLLRACGLGALLGLL